MLPVLAGYIAYSIAGKPGLVPGFVGGYLSGEVKAGFLGALLIGLLAGYVVDLIKRIPVSKYIRPIMPILVIPILSSAIVGVVMLKVFGIPIANLMTAAGAMLRTMGAGNQVILGLILGAMIAFDMGGPINKTAFFFGAAMIKEGNFHIMGACAAAICTPPLGMGLATLIRKRLWHCGLDHGPDRHHGRCDSICSFGSLTRHSFDRYRLNGCVGDRDVGRRGGSCAAWRSHRVACGRA